MLMGWHKPPADVMEFSKSARASEGLAGQVSCFGRLLVH